MKGTAWGPEKRVSVPRLTTRRRLYICAHEAGHVAKRHKKGNGHSHRHEYEAERWAHDALRRHGVAVPAKETRAGKEYVARKIHQAIRRGANNIDREALAWCKDFHTDATKEWIQLHDGEGD